MLVYWFGMNSAGMVQTYLINNDNFRAKKGLPKLLPEGHPDLEKQVIIPRPDEISKTRPSPIVQDAEVISSSSASASASSTTSSSTIKPKKGNKKRRKKRSKKN